MKKLIVIGLAVIFLLSASLSSAEEYTVKKGDCLSKIGEQFEAPWRDIAKVNKVKGPKYTIYIGHKLAIPRKPAKVSASTQYLDRIRSLRVQIAELEQKLKAAVDVQTVKQETVTVAETKQQTVVAPVIAAEKEETSTKVDVPVVIDTAKSYTANDRFSMYMSVGGWKSSGNKDESAGQYGQAKIRYRPFAFNLFGHEIGAGGFLMGETGSGSTGKWDFGWNKLGIGPSAKIYGYGWDASTDLGWTRQWDSGVNDKQVTDSVYLMEFVNLEQRRGADLKWFPQTELMFAAIMPFSASKESTKAGKTFGQSLPTNDKSVYSVEVKQSIYDFDFNNHMRLTPGILLGGGFEAGNSYGKIGPFVKLAAYGQDILIADLSIKDKSNVDGVRWYAGLMLNVSGAVKAIKASRITQPAAEDLQVK